MCTIEEERTSKMKTTAWTKVLVVNFLSSISVIKGVLFKRTIASTFNGSNLLADIFLFGPLHDSERHLLFLKDNHLHYISSIADQSTIQYEVPSPIQNARAILFRSDETIMSYSFPNRQLTSFSIFAWYHGNGMGKTSRPIVGIIGANLWNMGAQLYVGRQVEGKMALIFYTSVATIPTKTQVYSDSAIRVSNDVWNHVGVTFDASAGHVRFYLNGTQLGTPQSLSPITYPDVGRVSLGGFSNQAFCECALDGAEYYLRAISALEAQDMFARVYP
ncbi:uncharacterized protein LOC131878796 isoform X2 [Tigriopus californicus]|uniref:uncharacterized protein LOC131878796 isoform X2 n=1 Tax=Tigriopus californicus TaxID=6832 RepID=UPI0027DA659B|nr:uncharacterized protein LOC131878796 isoform X2 [Tigriopus californicus]